jgi:formate-dependent nitrite reductase membrane component NrfD
MSSSTIPINGDDREGRLLEIRREAQQHGHVQAAGVHAEGAPFPLASPENGYYGMPLLQRPAWTWQVPLYFFVGGASGAAAVIGAMADWVGHDQKIARRARIIALCGSMASSGLLISDLGRPERFFNMLRVFKPQSPMSMGAWILAAFGSSSGLAVLAPAIHKRLHWRTLGALGAVGKVSSALFGLPFSNYTGVLFAATAVPAWHDNADTLPFHFGMSALNSGTSVLELLGSDRSRALNFLGILATLMETCEGYHIEVNKKPTSEPLRHGASGRLTRIGGVLSGPLPLALRLASAVSGSRRARRWAAGLSLAGSLLTRYAWLSAGRASAADSRVPLELGAEGSEPSIYRAKQQKEPEERRRPARARLLPEIDIRGVRA